MAKLVLCSVAMAVLGEDATTFDPQLITDILIFYIMAEIGKAEIVIVFLQTTL